MVEHDLPDLVRVRRINDAAATDETYLALRVSDGGEVAVRVYAHPIDSTRDRERFDHEIETLGALNDDPHILTIHDAGVTDSGHPFVVSEFCPSGSLHDRIATVGGMTATEVRGIGYKLAGALARAHERDVYHRNIKPGNILIDALGEPVLADFGLVTLATSNGDFVMVAQPRAYTAPEAFLPELMTEAADIFSLGATLYALLAGRAPRAVDPLAVAVDGDTVADLPKVPWTLMTVLRRSMALDPWDRFADAEEFGIALASGP